VLLDATSVGPERILLLDTFFNVILWHGESVAAWKRDGLDQDPNYAYLKEVKCLLETHVDLQFGIVL
jgi:protein transport protein SEC23